jgi:phosphatidylserine decarboxylase
MLRTAEEHARVEAADEHGGGQHRGGPDEGYEHAASESGWLSRTLDRVFQQSDINFLVTNRIPRRQLTRFMGWFSRIEQPLVRDLSLAVWKLFAGDLALHEARKTHFSSLRDCFIRELKEGARPIDATPGVLVSPCDAIVGASGRIDGTTLVQAKGFEYALDDLVGDTALVERYRNGTYVTLRLTSSMYHRFHAPDDCRVDEVRYISGDTWNVNPIALRRVARLFCKNERAVVPLALGGPGDAVTLVAVGAILVASIRLNFLEVPFSQRYTGPMQLSCAAAFRRGDAMGYFEHGSTIIVLATPGLTLAAGVEEGVRIRMGEPLLEHGPIRPAG